MPSGWPTVNVMQIQSCSSRCVLTVEVALSLLLINGGWAWLAVGLAGLGDPACFSCEQSQGQAQPSPEQHILPSTGCLYPGGAEELGWRTGLVPLFCSQTGRFGACQTILKLPLSLPPVLLWLSLCIPGKWLVLLCPILWAGSLLRQGFSLQGSLAGLYFP